MNQRDIDSDDLTEESPHTFTGEASTLGFKPGEWPNSLTTDMGNGHNFERIRATIVGGECVSVTYRQLFGCLWLTVLND